MTASIGIGTSGGSATSPSSARSQLGSNGGRNGGEASAITLSRLGGPTQGTIVDVSTLEELENACRTVAAGGTIRLAKGDYVLKRQQWPLGDFPDQWAGLLANGVTLMGAGPGETVVYVPDDPAAYIMTYGNADIRNMSITASGPFAIVSNGTGLRLCPLDVYSAHSDPGVCISHIPFGGSASHVAIAACVIRSYKFQSTGVFLETCTATPEMHLITCVIEDCSITGWDIGVEWTSWDNCGPISVTADCDYITDNDSGNVLESDCSTGACDDVERCP